MGIKLRKAKKKDIEFLFNLRNQPLTYKYAKNAMPVQWQEHINWITPVIAGKTEKNLFIIEANKQRVGQARIDIEGKEATAHISLMEEFQGKGIASFALQMAMANVAKKKKVKTFSAEIHQDNIASQKLFEKLGYQFETQDGVWIKYVKTT